MSLQLDDTASAVAEFSCACLVRAADAADAAALAAFATRTFIDTYGRYNEPENLKRHLEATYGAEHQAREIADPDVATLLAFSADALAAFAQVRRGPAPPCVAGIAPVELHRFYVDARWHGAGVSQRLLAEVREAALAFGGATLWLKVWERNARAIAFYSKSGFVDVGTADFYVGVDRQTDRVLVMSLAA